MKIAINFKSVISIANIHEYGLRYVGCGMIKAGDYTQGSRNYYKVFNEQLFMLAVVKYGIDFEEVCI